MIPLIPFAAVAGGVLLLWHLPAALVVWIAHRIPLKGGGGYFDQVTGFIVALLWIASYAWPFAAIYGANQL
jgi:hypothetical protein